jgi:hypothetical protein
MVALPLSSIPGPDVFWTSLPALFRERRRTVGWADTVESFSVEPVSVEFVSVESLGIESVTISGELARLSLPGLAVALISVWRE